MDYAVSMPAKELKTVIKESVREALAQEFMRFRMLLLPYVLEKEQRDIEKLYGNPSCKTAKTVKVEI